MPSPPAPRDPDDQYPVMLCPHCGHPGGQHVVFQERCRLCLACPGWGDSHGVQGRWSDRQTDELLAAMEGSTDG